jgi:hypothetical protein
MNQIIKQNLQKMLNVAIAANIAAATTIISFQVSTSKIILEQFTSADRSLER